MCYFYNNTIAIMSDNRGSEVMLYFTDEVFCRLANHNDLGAMAMSSVA